MAVAWGAAARVALRGARVAAGLNGWCSRSSAIGHPRLNLRDCPAARWSHAVPPGNDSRGTSTEAESQQPRMAIQFTCTQCETRQIKTFAKRSYEHGVVIIICDGCGAKHLIADRLGWFEGEGSDVEAILAAKGEQVLRQGNMAGVVELTSAGGSTLQ